MEKRGFLEALFEGALWKGRLIAILAVVFGMIGAVSLFLIASADVWQMAVIHLNISLCIIIRIPFMKS